MNHLAIDTATEILSVALRVDSGHNSHRYVTMRDAGLRHTRNLMPIVEGLLIAADIRPEHLALISCMRGPGSFTGLRIGMATAKGLAVALDPDRPPLVSVSTLDVMVSAVTAPGCLVVPVIDGKKGRFYGAGYRDGERLTADLDLRPADLLAHTRAALSSRIEDDAQAYTSVAPPSASEPDVVVTGPHADRFVELLKDGEESGNWDTVVVDPAARAGWAAFLLDVAGSRLTEDGYDGIDQGPVYVRSSDAEIARGGSKSAPD